MFVADALDDRFKARRVAHEHVFEKVGGQAGMVSHYIARRDRASIRKARFDREFGQGGGQWLIDVDLALFGQLHGGGGGEYLGNRTGAVNGFRSGRNIVFEVGVTETFLPNDFLIIDQRNAYARDLVLRHLTVNQPGEVIFSVTVIAAGVIDRNGRGRGTSAK